MIASMRAAMAVMDRMSREDFGMFYRQTAPALRRYIARIAANADLADDLLQEAYIRLIDETPETSFKTVRSLTLR